MPKLSEQQPKPGDKVYMNVACDCGTHWFLWLGDGKFCCATAHQQGFPRRAPGDENVRFTNVEWAYDAPSVA